jgi:ABC-type oligopeptide transport system substrate-binding subunit
VLTFTLDVGKILRVNMSYSSSRFAPYSIALLACLIAAGCSALANNNGFFGKTDPPRGNVLRYITGDEPESLDPHKSTGQPETRVFLALYEGLVEYDPKTMDPIPALAERWDENNDSSEFVFHLRKNARWSNGDPINANDVVYSFRRALSPDTRARGAGLGYYIKYAQSYNSGDVFVLDPQNNTFLLEKDFSPAGGPQPPLSERSVGADGEYTPTEQENKPDRDTSFHQLMHSPARLTLPGDEKARNKVLAKDGKLAAAAAGKQFVKVRAEDIGVEAVDDYTIRISLSQSAPYFKGLLANPLFRLVPKKVLEQYGERWTDVDHIVSCGPFKLQSWKPYDVLKVVRDPMYWDAANVHLDEIDFYPTADLPTEVNLYRVGQVDALGNHAVLNAWVETVRVMKDYMDAPEASSIYIDINTTKAPMNDLRVRKAFDLAIDKDTWVKWRKITKPLPAITPSGIFHDYQLPVAAKFDPEQARQLLADAGYPVTKNSDGSYRCAKFPADQVEYVYPSATPNKIMAEFMQAQWKQNLGIVVPLRSMEFKTFLEVRASLDYKGFAFGAFSADYIDPFTFLSIFYTPTGDNGTGWWDQKYVDLLNEGNRTPDRLKRFDILSRAESYMLAAQPIIPIETGAVNWLKKPYVKGLYPNAGSVHAWKYVYLERDPAKWDYGVPDMK